MLLVLLVLAVPAILTLTVVAVFAISLAVVRRRVTPHTRSYELLPTGAIPGQRRPMRTPQQV